MLTHPKTAVAAIILRDHEILMVRRGVEPGLGKWSIPGGSIELGETMEDALRREVWEETGLEIKVGDFAGVIDLIVRDENGQISFHYVILDYFATIISDGEACPATDVTECRWIPLDELKNYDITESLIKRLTRLGLLE